ncbi:hypothetical protein OCU04_009912 [Sclerotinia nivalis]|uniref:Uncharacterized protein n=1 Tax=Sclerotinia nivalis TaxID=352851 RepID=A0A9X0DHC9_9HELO|nr:hypothetical protein OCU04_009912 [Sclerotinia nivalis]
MTSPNTAPLQALKAPQSTRSPSPSAITQLRASESSGKRALDLEGTSVPRQKRLRSIPVAEGEAGEDGVVVGGILKVKLRHRNLAQAFLTREDGTNLVIPHEVFLQLLKVLHEKDDIATLICLSVVRKAFWDFRKSQLHRNFSELSADTKLTLAPRLSKWMGSNYRMASRKTLAVAAERQCNVMYLSRDIYGEEDSDEEAAMVSRYNTRYYLQIPEPRKRGPTAYRTLASPFDEGVEWNRSVLID